MTPAQCRAARALLGMTQSQLARAANLGLSTVVDFEKERRLVSDEASSAIRLALQRAGIEFTDGNGGGKVFGFENRDFQDGNDLVAVDPRPSLSLPDYCTGFWNHAAGCAR
jgi:transcriptional regulator with XRE-family HTH domain